MKLYGFPLSPNSRRVQICAAELGLPLDVKNLDFAGGEQRAPGYLALNPMGKVPTITDGDFALWESAAILCHLAASRPGALWPADARAQAHVFQWLFFTSCHLNPYFTTLVVERLIKPRRGAATDEARVAAAIESLGRFLAIVEEQLAGREYLTGTFGIADIAAGCTVELASLVLFDLAPYPHTRGWLARLGARGSWRSSAATVAAA